MKSNIKGTTFPSKPANITLHHGLLNTSAPVKANRSISCNQPAAGDGQNLNLPFGSQTEHRNPRAREAREGEITDL